MNSTRHSTTDVPALPVVHTQLPGPRSAAICEAEGALLSGGHSAGAAWAGLAIESGVDAMVRDADGNWLLDACSGTVVMNVGHGRREVAQALFDQAGQLTHYYDFASSARVAFLERLKETLPQELDSFHMTNSGTEAVEAALRFARSATGRHEIVAFHHGYHGRSYGALSLTTGGAREGLGPLLPGVYHSPSAYCFRCPLSQDPTTCQVECGDSLEATISNELTEIPAAIVIEPMQGAGGMIPMPSRFLERLRRYCDDTGALLVFDEILTGAGRTGRFWAMEHSGVVPDMLLLGKGLGGGYPLGVVAGRRELMHTGPLSNPTRNSSTFGGGPLACVAASAVLEVLRSEGLVDRSAEVGARVRQVFEARCRDIPLVGDVRGLGLAIGIELVGRQGEPATGDVPMRVLQELRDRGVLVSSSSHVLRITPPLCITDEQAEFLSEAVVTVLEEVDRSLGEFS